MNNVDYKIQYRVDTILMPSVVISELRIFTMVFENS